MIPHYQLHWAYKKIDDKCYYSYGDQGHNESKSKFFNNFSIVVHFFDGIQWILAEASTDCADWDGLRRFICCGRDRGSRGLGWITQILYWTYQEIDEDNNHCKGNEEQEILGDFTNYVEKFH